MTPVSALRQGAHRVALARRLSDDWRAHGLAARPADRPAAEAAVVALYRLIDAPAPEFVWVPSPTAALSIVHDDPHTFPPVHFQGANLPKYPEGWPLAAQLANLVQDLRHSLDRAVGHGVSRGS